MSICPLLSVLGGFVLPGAATRLGLGAVATACSGDSTLVMEDAGVGVIFLCFVGMKLGSPELFC